ncbi:hypothetical protein D5H75_39800 [Bailinhaonella thermotolerans]|uniref:Uncharacterized protein n=2 Tax=Bailinhaonella thermotolerans TaxID=1070861 RepID=A0A3A4AHV6_9ACTN|nr:hypothetical protein D5H75_39800 [Bailinhaonella thermotolerans]
MLDRPEMVAAWTAQLRRVLSEQAEYVAKIRRDAEAMWRANPPEGYTSFEAWWRHKWVSAPFGEIQEHLERAAELTFRAEARYRRGRHEIPAARQQAKQARQAPALPRRTDAGPGRAGGGRAGSGPEPVSFMEMVTDTDRRKWSA